MNILAIKAFIMFALLVRKGKNTNVKLILLTLNIMKDDMMRKGGLESGKGSYKLRRYH